MRILGRRPARLLAGAAKHPASIVLVLLISPILWPSPTQAQDIWPERGQNLQALPADLPKDNLRAVMVGFSQALGVRCSYCHVGVEGQPLTTFDFVSDENPMKDKARDMLGLLGEVNDYLSDLEPSGPQRVNMWCHTCHSGKPRPQTLEESLTETWTEGGGEAAVARFLALRGEFYGGNQYDFRPMTVNTMAAGLLQAGDTATAVRFLELNVDHHPGFAIGHASLGDVALMRGDSARAVTHYEKAVELSPGDPQIQERLRRAKGGG